MTSEHGGAPVAAPPVEPGSIGPSVLRGSAWTMGGYAMGQLLRLAGNLVLARVLFPAVFGQMALVNVFIQGLTMFSDVGTGPAIIQGSRGDDPVFLNTAWTIQVVRGLLLWLASWALAWPVAAFYDQPLLGWVIPAAALSAVAAGFESTGMHTEQRHLRLGRLTVVEFAAQAAGIVASVLLAIGYRYAYEPNDPRAVWAVVMGGLVASGVRLVLSHTFLPGVRHRFHLERAALDHLFGFGRWIFLSTVLTFLASQSDRLIFGKLIPLEVFGVYSLAAMLAMLPTQAVLKLSQSVIFPMYSRLAGEAGFREAFWRVRWLLLIGGGAVVSALIACGPYLVGTLYDSRYSEAGWILQYLAAMAWFQILECTNGAALLAHGRVAWVAAGGVSKVLGLAVLVPVGYHLGALPGALVALVLSDFLKYLTVAAGATLLGLRGFGPDAFLTSGVAIASLLGTLSTRGTLVGPGLRNVNALATATVAALTLWVVFGAWHLWRAKLIRS
jgi:O-antigen/teichoic acid export membrane protein